MTDKDQKYSTDYVSYPFLGLRSMGLFAPLSYWRSGDDTGIGDIDTLYKVIDFAKDTDQSVIQMLPLNLPSADNCPYAIASNYIFDPVYIGIKSLFDFICKSPGYSEAKDMFRSRETEFAGLRKGRKSVNEKIRQIKYEIFRVVFDIFKKEELNNIASITDINGFKVGKNDGSLKAGFINYCRKNGSWIFDHCLFFILMKEYKTEDFRKWPDKIARRDEKTIGELKIKYDDPILFETFLQWILTVQMKEIVRYAKSGDKSVDIMLDQPFAFGNADVWINMKAFHINPKTLRKDFTQGVPPHRLDIPQHWQFTLLNFDKPHAKRLLLNRLEFLLEFCTLLRIDHLLGYYQLYYLSEDLEWKMTPGRMKIWEEIDGIRKSGMSIGEKRGKIYSIIVNGLKSKLGPEIRSRVFDGNGNLRYGNVILGCRRNFPNGDYDKNVSGWYEVNSTEFSQKLIYTLLSPNGYGEDYLSKIIQDDRYFLKPDDSIRIGFFNPGLGEEIVSDFIRIAHRQCKELVLENLGLVPDKVTRSMKELGVSEFKPLYFGYQYFKGDHNAYWFDNITDRDYCSFSIHDTVTIEGWWTGDGYWAEKKYYFTDVQQKTAIRNWLIHGNYLAYDGDFSAEKLTKEVHRALLASVSDSNANMAVFMMPDIFKSGEEGIINIPGYGGFWTARSPVTIENLSADSARETKPGGEFEPVPLIRHLSAYRKRNSVKDQLDAYAGGIPCIIRTYPFCGSGFKQIGFLNDSFMVDAVVFGKTDKVELWLNGNIFSEMKKMTVKTAIPDGLSVYRIFVPVTEEMVRTNVFKILIDGEIKTGDGYLVGLPSNTDTNPLSDNYGRTVMR
jgi:4-alpha-glucanotransferase